MTLLKRMLCAIALCLALGVEAAPTGNFNVVPRPQSVECSSSEFVTLNGKTKICYAPGQKDNANFLHQYIKELTGLDLKISQKLQNPKKNSSDIFISVIPNGDKPEGYSITSDKHGIAIVGGSKAGLFYGIQTLRKALPVGNNAEVSLPCGKVTDYPCFKYRGMMLDVARHYFTPDSVKMYIDILALHNENRFHWHLSDDQGWRIEIKSRPLLTEIGSKRDQTVLGRNSGNYDGTKHGGYYTQAEIRDIVKYAAERHITVIPEIDLPGHMQAALSAYPELGCTGGPYNVWQQWGVSDNILCAGNPDVLTFLKDVLTEVCDLFPSHYIHIGGDECPRDKWEKCPKCQAKAKELGIVAHDGKSVEAQLQTYIMTYVENFLATKGRDVIGWDEILEGGLGPKATVHAWRGINHAVDAAKQGHDAIVSPGSHLYFDHYQSQDVEAEPLAIGGFTPVERVYSFDPYPADLTKDQRKHIIGIQANLWTEYVPNFRHAEYMVLPRMAALSEVQWTDPALKNYDDFLVRLNRLTHDYDALGYNYAKHVFNVIVKQTPLTDKAGYKVELSTVDGSPIVCNGKPYTGPFEVTKSSDFEAYAIHQGTPLSKVKQSYIFSKATLKPITLNCKLHPSYVYGGEKTLVDGQCGTANFNTGFWLGIVDNDFNATIDLQKEESVSEVKFNTCVNTGSWVYDCRKAEVLVSNDGTNFTSVATETYPALEDGTPNKVFNHTVKFAPVNARFVKVIIAPEYQIPAWHAGAAGKPGFIFIDEIMVF